MTIFCFPKELKPHQRHVRNRRWIIALTGGLLLLSGCNSLPDSGPTESRINSSQRNPKKNAVGYSIIPITPQLISSLQSEAPPLFSSLDSADPHPMRTSTNDTIGPGDVIQVAVYEVGTALFGSSSSAMSAASSSSGNGLLGAAQPSPIPLLGVDGNGNVQVPFVGQINVAGMTASQAAQAIQSRLKQKSAAPQVMVRIATDIANSVMVYGGVRRPSRIPLTPNREHILDVIALAGGQEHASQTQNQVQNQMDEDYMVRLTRNGRVTEVPLKVVEDDPSQNIVMQPGDRVQLTYEPRTFTSFGASEHVNQIQFPTPILTMTDAISLIGGPSDARADPNAVYLFRFEHTDVLQRMGISVDTSAPTAPVVYQIDMMNPSNYFLAQKFIMRDRDLIYVANAASNKFYKFFSLISTVIAPGIAAAWIVR
ncbi:sugar transporter [Komagataeibacter rhaeticus]|uniref:polysaccharide biosynthesis/export family protein n=1 Tax=Komagataeibacter rhaeticus TaxID=215221 RepID=UPI00020805E2|nr:polysaccharide biosynthesis/export family protein [Komagataeibacter rhaeticus]ATU73963.1 sugar transporter [Komagataeibacter xylinus]EGG77803.1 Capsule polysaccharide export protein BexD [Gluconacetobacter sp. SXCC-1]KDU95117.1 sugar transporter [Komagataeibacter rhaeticus AF1]PYD54954.1 sugar transporter [Komagataeibacter rhaeticus]WPP20979.1 polysaccharide biosynthesis/export family protein [Komagataeibacter rhaeticus]